MSNEVTGLILLFTLPFMFVGALAFLGWLVNKHPPPDVNTELKTMKQSKELELKNYKENL